MSKEPKEEKNSSLIVYDIIHDLKTSLMVINSSLNSTKDIFPKLIEAYDLSTLKNNISYDSEILFIKKIFNSIDNSIKEIKLTNYNVEKIRDILKSYSGHINKSDRIILYDVIKQAIDFHKLKFKICDKKIFLDDRMKDIAIFTEKRTIKKAFTYFIENIIKLSMMNEKSEVQVSFSCKKEKTVCSFVITNYISEKIKLTSLFDQSLSYCYPKIGQGMYYFREFLKESGWDFSETIGKSIFKIDLLFYKNNGGCDEL